MVLWCGVSMIVAWWWWWRYCWAWITNVLQRMNKMFAFEKKKSQRTKYFVFVFLFNNQCFLSLRPTWSHPQSHRLQALASLACQTFNVILYGHWRIPRIGLVFGSQIAQMWIWFHLEIPGFRCYRLFMHLGSRFFMKWNKVHEDSSPMMVESGGDEEEDLKGVFFFFCYLKINIKMTKSF